MLACGNGASHGIAPLSPLFSDRGVTDTINSITGDCWTRPPMHRQGAMQHALGPSRLLVQQYKTECLCAAAASQHRQCPPGLGTLQDAMETAAQSGDVEIASELLHFFVDNKEKECFAATLYTCYDLIKPDVALEVGQCSGQSVAGSCICSCFHMDEDLGCLEEAAGICAMRRHAAGWQHGLEMSILMGCPGTSFDWQGVCLLQHHQAAVTLQSWGSAVRWSVCCSAAQ